MKKHLIHALEAASIVVLAQVPAIIASPAVQSLIEHHPAVAVYVPIAAGIASALYRALKPKKA